MISSPRMIRRPMGTAVLLLSCVMGAAFAQLNPDEIRDPQLKALEKTYLAQLRAANVEIARLRFPFPFLLSRYVGLDPKKQLDTDTRGLEFVNFHGQTVLKVTGNYNAAYNAAVLTENQRASRVVEEVISPVLGVVCRDVPASGDFRIGFEISFHVRRRERDYDFEGKEILVVILTRGDAMAYIKSQDTPERQGILDRSEVYLNGKPYGLMLGERDAYPVTEARAAVPNRPLSETLDPPIVIATKEPSVEEKALLAARSVAAKPASAVSAGLMKNLGVEDVRPRADAVENAPQARATSPDAVKNLQTSYQSSIDRMVQELEAQAHFVHYAPPAFIPFHKGLYLQLSVTTTLPQTTEGSQYHLAALAFDQHIAHLIRPVLAYFKDCADFDGIDFSTTVRLDQHTGGSALAVELIFPRKGLSAYADFDSTGQQLIDGSFVLINGERVSLNLQAAESVPLGQARTERH